jgi:hypothetical protein
MEAQRIGRASVDKEEGPMRQLPRWKHRRAPVLPGQPSQRDPASGLNRPESPRCAVLSPSSCCRTAHTSIGGGHTERRPEGGQAILTFGGRLGHCGEAPICKR